MDPCPPEPIVTGVSAEELAAIELLYRAFSDTDPDLLDLAIAQDWQDIPLAPGQGPGLDGFKPLVRAFLEAFPDIKISIYEIIGAPGRAAVRANITGTHSGEWFGVLPTGKRFSIAIHEFHYIRNGRITRTWHLEDWLGWFRQVGARPTE